jgi:type IV pilus assembly protein PilB
MDTKDPIVAFIEQEKLLSKKNLKEVVREHEETGLGILNILRHEDYLDEDQLLRVLAVDNDIEFIDLQPESIEQVVAHLVSFELADRHCLIPMSIEDNKLLVAMSAPMNLMVRDQVAAKTGYDVVPKAATTTAIRLALQYQFDVANETKQAIASMRLKGDKEPEAEEPSSELILGDVKNPITKLVTSIVRGAIDAGASDIHIEPQEEDARVRYRVDGVLQNALTVPASAQNEVVSHIKIKAGMDISEKRVPQDGHISISHNGRSYDLRVSSLPSVGGEKIVIRVLDKDANKWNLDTVVTDPDANERFRKLAANPNGMLLVTGPTGSGKTTTLYSLLKLLNTPKRNVITVEDPVEYRLDGVTQVQVRPVAGMTFASALKSILRQDPDIILIGEIRDLETAEIAVSAALTGHLVLSTLHTNDAPGAISRLINIGVPPFLVGSALIGTVAQRLVRIACPKCRKRYKAPKADLKLLLGKEAPNKDVRVAKARGCNDCYQTGYKGRKSIYEILPVSSAIRRLILEGKNDDVIRRQAVKEGMKTLAHSAVAEVLDGLTTIDEITRTIEIRDK